MAAVARALLATRGASCTRLASLRRARAVPTARWVHTAGGTGAPAASESAAQAVGTAAAHAPEAAWPPIAAVQDALVALHDTSGLPWWATIAVGTVIVRGVILPAAIYQQRQISRLAHLRPLVRAVVESCRHVKHAPRRHAQTLTGIWNVCVQNGVHPVSLFSGALVQLPVFILCVVSVRRMLLAAGSGTGAAAAAGGADHAGAAAAPSAPAHALVSGAEGLVDGGALWFPDLSAADPLGALPVVTIASFLLTTEVSRIVSASAEQAPAGASADGPAWLSFLRHRLQDIGVIALPAIAQLPCGVFMYWLPNNLLSLSQLVAFRQPAVRAALGLDPPPPEHLRERSDGGTVHRTARAVFLEQARALEAKDDAQAAAEVYKRAVQANPNDVEAAVALVRLLLKSESTEAHALAVAVLKPIVETQPDSRPARLALTSALHRLGDSAAAEVELLALLERDAGDVQARITYAAVLADPGVPVEVPLPGGAEEAGQQPGAAPERATPEPLPVDIDGAVEQLAIAALHARKRGQADVGVWCDREIAQLRQRLGEQGGSARGGTRQQGRPQEHRRSRRAKESDK